MKQLIALLLICMAALPTQAQQPVANFDAPIWVQLTNDTISGVPLLRKAEFECLIYNRRSQSVSLQWKVYHYTTDSVPFAIVPPRQVECVADRLGYVLPNGAYIGDMNAVLQSFGIKDAGGNYTKNAQGDYLLSQPGIMSEYDFFVYLSTLPISIQEAVYNNGLSNAKLQRKWPY